MDIGGILKGIGAAATNPLAFVAYIFAVIGWFVLRSRVERNKNILAKISSVPETDRAQVLFAEMGVPSLKEGLSPEQWIRSKNNTYYFLGFVVLCAVLVILFAISAFTRSTKTVVVPQAPPMAEDPDQASMKTLDEMDLGLHKDFVISKFGQPPHVGTYVTKKGTCSQYKFSFATVNFVFDGNDDVAAIYVIKQRDNYRPNFWTHYAWTPLNKNETCLGCFSFADVGHFEVLTFNYGASDEEHFPTFYAENTGAIPPKANRVLFLVYTSQGWQDTESEKALTGEIITALEKYQQGNDQQDFNTYFERLPEEQQKTFLKAREHLSPNAYAVVRELHFEEQFLELEDIRQGGFYALDCSF